VERSLKDVAWDRRSAFRNLASVFRDVGFRDVASTFPDEVFLFPGVASWFRDVAFLFQDEASLFHGGISSFREAASVRSWILGAAVSLRSWIPREAVSVRSWIPREVVSVRSLTPDEQAFVKAEGRGESEDYERQILPSGRPSFNLQQFLGRFPSPTSIPIIRVSLR